MTFQEALTKMQNGIPMRRPEWEPWMYYRVRGNDIILCRDGEGSRVLGWPNISIGAVPVPHILADDWEEFTGKVIPIMDLIKGTTPYGT